MKVKRSKLKFRPITITLTTMTELRYLTILLSATGWNQDREILGKEGAYFIQELYNQLSDINDKT